MTANVHAAIAPTGLRGQLVHSILDGDQNTYSVSGVIAGFVGQTIQINGNSSNIVRIQHIDISLTAAAAALTTLQLQRTSTTAVGGGATAFSVAKHDTTNPNSVSGVNWYTSAPTQGTPIGSPVRSVAVGIAATGPLLQVQNWDFCIGPKQGLIIRNGEFFAIVLGANSAGSTMAVSIEWTESTT